MSSRDGNALTVPSKLSLSISTHCGTLRPSRASRAPAMRAIFRDFSRTDTFVPGRAAEVLPALLEMENESS